MVADPFVSVVEGIAEVAVVVLPHAAVGAVIAIPLRRRSRIQKNAKQARCGAWRSPGGALEAAALQQAI
jgi:hypothetical protein